MPGLTLNNDAERIADTFATAKHLVLIVVDGLGLNFVNKMDGTSFLPKHVALKLQTVFPSTTSSAFTSFATAKWPSQHSIIGWDMYLEEIDTVSTIIRSVRRHDDNPLGSLGIEENQT